MTIKSTPESFQNVANSFFLRKDGLPNLDQAQASPRSWKRFAYAEGTLTIICGTLICGLGAFLVFRFGARGVTSINASFYKLPGTVLVVAMALSGLGTLYGVRKSKQATEALAIEKDKFLTSLSSDFHNYVRANKDALGSKNTYAGFKFINEMQQTEYVLTNGEQTEYVFESQLDEWVKSNGYQICDALDFALATKPLPN